MHSTFRRAEWFWRNSTFRARVHFHRLSCISRVFRRCASRFFGRTLSSMIPSCRSVVREIPCSCCRGMTVFVFRGPRDNFANISRSGASINVVPCSPSSPKSPISSPVISCRSPQPFSFGGLPSPFPHVIASPHTCTVSRSFPRRVSRFSARVYYSVRAL